MFYQPLSGLSTYVIPGTLPSFSYEKNEGHENDGWMVRNPAPNAGKSAPKKKEKSDCEKLKDFQRTFPNSWRYMAPGAWITKCGAGRGSKGRGTTTAKNTKTKSSTSHSSSTPPMPPLVNPSPVAPGPYATESNPMPTANLPPITASTAPPKTKWGLIAAAGLGAILLLKKK